MENKEYSTFRFLILWLPSSGFTRAIRIVKLVLDAIILPNSKFSDLYRLLD